MTVFRFLLGTVSLCSVCLLSGCFSSDNLPVGEKVIVQFDRSALGAGSTPISPTTDSMNGAATSMRGKLVYASEEWLQIEIEDEGIKKSFWISRDKVLLLQKGGF